MMCMSATQWKNRAIFRQIFMSVFTKFEKKKSEKIKTADKEKTGQTHFCFLSPQSPLLPIWHGVELGSTHLKKFQGTERMRKIKQWNHWDVRCFSLVKQEESYFEILAVFDRHKGLTSSGGSFLVSSLVLYQSSAETAPPAPFPGPQNSHPSDVENLEV